jgi:hypothetical protein
MISFFGAFNAVSLPKFTAMWYRLGTMVLKYRVVLLIILALITGYMG